MIFAKIASRYSLGAGFCRHPVSSAGFGKTGGVFAAGVARVVIGDSTARKWPEVIDPVGGRTLLFSERITDQLRTFGFSGIEFYPVEIVRAESIWLEKKQPPIYYWARIFGEASVHVFINGVETHPNPSSGLVEITLEDMAFSRRTIRFNPNDWDGTDFFRLANIFSGKRYCSQRVVEALDKLRCPDIVVVRTNENLELNF